MFFVAVLAGKRAGRRRPASLIRAGFAILGVGVLALIPLIPSADTSLPLVIPLMFCGAGMGLLVSQLNNYTLAPLSEEQVGEGAGVNSSISSFGLSVGLAFVGAILLAALSITFTNKTDASDILPADEKEQIAQVLEDDAQVMSDASLEEQLDVAAAGDPRRGPADQRRGAASGASDRSAHPAAGEHRRLFWGSQMMRLPDPAPTDAAQSRGPLA